MKVKTYTSYSTQIATEYIDIQKPSTLISSTLQPQYRYVDNKFTDEIVGYKAWFSQEGVEPFQVKFSEEIELPEYLSKVQFENLMACIVQKNVYFKADDLKEIK